MNEQPGKDTFIIGERHGSVLTQAALEKALKRVNMHVSRVQEDADVRGCRSAQNLESGQVERILRSVGETYIDLIEQHACLAQMRRGWTVHASNCDLDVEAVRRSRLSPADLVRVFKIQEVRLVFPNDELCAAYHAASLTFNAELNNVNPALPPLMKRTKKLTSVGDECYVYVGPTPAYAAVSKDRGQIPVVIMWPSTCFAAGRCSS